MWRRLGSDGPQWWATQARIAQLVANSGTRVHDVALRSQGHQDAPAAGRVRARRAEGLSRQPRRPARGGGGLLHPALARTAADPRPYGPLAHLQRGPTPPDAAGVSRVRRAGSVRRAG